eukprot:364225-Chlamydomonas_euryale.AAC.5
MYRMLLRRGRPRPCLQRRFGQSETVADLGRALCCVPAHQSMGHLVLHIGGSFPRRPRKAA